MPPRRKSKASQAAPASDPNTSSRNKVSEAARPGQVRRNSLAASSGRTSRLLPSVPFQMTTRRGAKTASAASSATSGSRRSSMDDNAQYDNAQSENEDERPAKRSRTSTDSGSPQRSNASSDDKTTMDGIETPELQKPAAGATLIASKTAPKRRRASDESTLSTRPNGVLTQTHSDVSEAHPRSKRRKTKEAPADSADQPPELTDASTAPNSPEPMPDVDSHSQNVLPTNGDAPAKPGRRLPGRRRQPHSDVNIEVDLRRQLNLKMSYRSLAKVQKTLLEELSNRTIKNLKEDADYHSKCPEHKPMMAALDQYRDSRLDQLNASRTYRSQQVERVRIAEKRIQEEQYINRFQELQDDFLLQCYFRMKQLEREMRGEAEDATDDEDNILPPTYTDEPHHDVDDRIGSKFASRSRAYVEADREIEHDQRRKVFDLARSAFVEKDEDADDCIDEIAGGFARFSGPEREEAVAHYNLNSIADAAIEVERTPSPEPLPQRIAVLPNAEAIGLMALAELSIQQPLDVHASHVVSQQETPQKPRPETPKREVEPSQRSAPTTLKQEHSLDAAPYAGQESPMQTSPSSYQASQNTPHATTNSVAQIQEPEQSITQPARVSTHRIMDMLNNDQDVPVYRSREPQTMMQDPSTPARYEANPVTRQEESTYRDRAPSFHAPPLMDGVSRYETHERAPLAAAHGGQEPPPVDQALMDALGRRPSEPPATPPQPQTWPRPSIAPPPMESEEALRKKDPLQKLQAFLGRRTSDRPWSSSRPSIYSSPATQERPDVAGYDPQRPAVGLYSAASAPPPMYPSARRESQDQGLPHWDRDRRMSGTFAPPHASPYQTNPPQLHPQESRGGPTPPIHQSPYAPPPPSGSLHLPPKPPGPAPMNFRFAHYDPAPPRPSYPPQSPTFPHNSQPHMGPPPPQYPPYPPYPGSYVPPPGSFQAPPPPPSALSSIAPYPPLKIHQYGGQPILPANLAPSLSGAAGPFSGQPQHSAYSPPPPPPQIPQHAQPSASIYEPRRDNKPAKPAGPDGVPRPRRPYRSYHAPGTQFRTYKGPRGGRSSGDS